ncbi:hypothetical protein [Gloeocapsopsis dulcis]|uniref:DUF4760 domain-containing protein n=1 Tax=Gloeocapsopsis dulcis AAB1 = 1H9 TaxID=1433147 RepID=A0A6N8FUX2_9CHRO|nr:hypothetical protein [Gloeocapsopsis dulcis]MUL35746.1 hypothetical protein [Gloeocapsopsis dulcis AAB1 = 1H9]WNN90970.1 hypothetical protein P0S91_07815 [Gloeocapsopsis dulcis]
MEVDITEFRNWLTFSLTFFGGYIALKTYLNNQKQRKLENSFRIILMFRKSLHEGDIQAWEKIFHATSESVGAERGHFVEIIDDESRQIPLSYLFSEGAPDNGAVGRMADLFELISSEVLNKTVEFRVVYFQLGQLMDTTYYWLRFIDNPYEEYTSFLEKHYPCFTRLYNKHQIDEKWAKRMYAYIG